MSRVPRSYPARPFQASCYFPAGWLVSVPLSRDPCPMHTHQEPGSHHHTISPPFKRPPGQTAQLPSLQADSHRQMKTAGSHLLCGPWSPLPCETLLLTKVPPGMVSVCVGGWGGVLGPGRTGCCALTLLSPSCTVPLSPALCLLPMQVSWAAIAHSHRLGLRTTE